MSKLTALQQAMRIVEKYAPNLFNVFSQDSRDFLNEVRPYLEQEKRQIIAAYLEGRDDEDTAHLDETFERTYEDYYRETYGGEP